jgi:protein-S-isoprenylcysteine O-methyltransferase Ste14
VAIAATGLVITHGLVPVSVGRRSGRSVARPPSAVTLAAIGCLLAGTTGVAWSLAQHVEAAPEGGYEVITLAPEYLLRTGPYRFSRNPMYASEVMVWVGWTLLFADPVLAGLTGLLALGLDRAARLEETALAARFGDTWREYTARTPRWIAMVRLS